MNARFAKVSGTASTLIAGVLLATLSLSAFGATRTLSAFVALALFAVVMGYIIARHR